MSFLVMSFVFVKTCVEKVFVHPPQIIELETSLYIIVVAGDIYTLS